METKKWSTTMIIWCVVLILTALTFLYNLAEVKNITNAGTYILPSKDVAIGLPVIEKPVKGYLIKTPGCTIPDLKIMDPSIKQYIFKEKNVVCNNGLPALYESNRTAIYLVEESMNYYNIQDVNLLKCCYQYFRRAKPSKDQDDKKVIYDEKCQLVNSSAYIQPDEEFLRIKCQYSTKVIYKDFFSFIPVKSDAIYDSTLEFNNKNEKSSNTNTKLNKSENVTRSLMNSSESNPNKVNLKEETLNVLVIGIDAVSRLNFHRQMPKTAFYLEKLNAFELLGYNKIGDNTYPNLIAALTGHDENEIAKTCWTNKDLHFDDCPFIWKNFKNAGYLTGFGEDAAWMGLFYYQKRGFSQKPTDYYYDQFDLTATNEAGNNHRLNVDQCIGSKQAYQVFLDYINNFAITMEEYSKKFFGFFWTSSLSHDYLNKPKLGDQDYMNVLFNLDEEGVLNKTCLIILSDHGIRWGSIRTTYQGRMEERLPFLYIALPQWYRDKFSEFDHNLKVNVRRLTTPFDLHETFLDVLNPGRFVKSLGNGENMPRGISLFREIPKNRTCVDAGIEQHWCTCQNSVKVAVDAPEVVKVVDFTVGYINSLLIGYADCLELRLDSVLDAMELTNDNEMKDYTKSVRDFTVTFKTVPGEAIFEATVRRDDSEDRVVGGNNNFKYSVTGTVSRINLYGQQSRCISDFHLKLYCYCRTYFGN